MNKLLQRKFSVNVLSSRIVGYGHNLYDFALQ